MDRRGDGFQILVGGRPASGAVVVIGDPSATGVVAGWVATRRETRARTVAELVDVRIRERVADGEDPRSDGFFSDSGADLAEAVLTAAEGEFEALKLPLLAELATSVAFDASIDAAMANLALRTVQRLSYRQLCLLAALGRNLGIALMRHDYRGVVGDEARAAVGWVVDASNTGGMVEALELVQLGLIRRRDNRPVASWADIPPAEMVLDGIALTIVALALMKLEKSAIEAMVETLLEDAYDRGEA